MVSNDGKREIHKEDTLYLWWNQTTKAVTIWETSLGCKHNHVKHVEDCDVVENVVKLVQEGAERRWQEWVDQKWRWLDAETWGMSRK